MYKLTQITPKIYCVYFLDAYDLAMTFFRYSVSYEAPNGKSLAGSGNYEDLMKNSTQPVFTYPDDWGAFNIPSHAIEDAFSLINDVPNKWDNIMMSIYGQIRVETQDEFYLMGVPACSLDMREYFKHELAHALWSSSESYQDLMGARLADFGIKHPILFAQTLQVLVDMGYAGHVLEDEMQAYMATGLTEELDDLGLAKHCPPMVYLFEEVFGDLFQ